MFTLLRLNTIYQKYFIYRKDVNWRNQLVGQMKQNSGKLVRN